MTCTRLECTASISMETTGDPGGNGSTTLVTKKCFSLLRGVTAVHFVCNSFFGLKALVDALVIMERRVSTPGVSPAPIVEES